MKCEVFSFLFPNGGAKSLVKHRRKSILTEVRHKDFRSQSSPEGPFGTSCVPPYMALLTPTPDILVWGTIGCCTKKFRLRWNNCTTAVEQKFHCGENVVPLRWNFCSTVVCLKSNCAGPFFRTKKECVWCSVSIRILFHLLLEL